MGIFKGVYKGFSWYNYLEIPICFVVVGMILLWKIKERRSGKCR
jgi:hypothetical protein